jgi:ribulose-phosphate 3-epimerase
MTRCAIVTFLETKGSTMIKVAPSILAGDFGKLGQEAARAQEAGADLLHVDIMDGHFVPNITVGPQAVAALRKATTLPLDVHLMLQQPDKHIDAFISAGADMISVHVEADHDLEKTLDRLLAQKIRPCVVFNPDTAFRLSAKVLDKIHMVLFMSVYPGFGGQKFIPAVLEKIKGARSILQGRKIDIEIDGGITLETGKAAVEAGANVLVAGTSIYSSPDMGKTVAQMKAL